MAKEKKIFPTEKVELHPRNKHKNRYNFKELSISYPELSSFVKINKFGDETINFSDNNAIKALNKAILINQYNIKYWDIPNNYLCPPIPGRADYIHYIADLIASSNNGIIKKNENVTILDIGVGSNCIYPIIGNSEYDWKFIGSDINTNSIQSSQKIIESNPHLIAKIEIRIQKNKKHFFHGIINKTEKIDVTICNPPFHSSLDEVKENSNRKWKGLGKIKNNAIKLNFGGQDSELWCEGGEVKFICDMINESVQYSENCNWFTTLVSKQKNLSPIYKALKLINVKEIKTIEMNQGQKTSRIVAWRFK